MPGSDPERSTSTRFFLEPLSTCRKFPNQSGQRSNSTGHLWLQLRFSTLESCAVEQVNLESFMALKSQHSVC